MTKMDDVFILTSSLLSPCLETNFCGYEIGWNRSENFSRATGRQQDY